MKNKNKLRIEPLIKIILILAWMAFIGFLIEAGSILASYGVSCINPEAAKNLYRRLNLYNLRQFNFWHSSMTVSFLAALQVLKSLAFFQGIKNLPNGNPGNPFTRMFIRRLERISYITFGTWVVAMIMMSNTYTSFLKQITGKLYGNWISAELILMVGLVFIISQVFKSGVEIESENDLTI